MGFLIDEKSDFWNKLSLSNILDSHQNEREFFFQGIIINNIANAFYDLDFCFGPLHVERGFRVHESEIFSDKAARGVDLVDHFVLLFNQIQHVFRIS